MNGVILQILGTICVIVASDEDVDALVYLGWIAAGIGGAVLFVGLVAFGVLLGSHAYRQERP